MRSVFIHLSTASLESVTALLTRLCPHQPGPPWVWMRNGDPCLYINCTDTDVDEGMAFTATFDAVPSVTITADVSGRHPGDAEVRSLLCAVLRAFTGVAEDDYTEHCWTLEEVLSGVNVEGHPFFDYRGWYEPLKLG